MKSLINLLPWKPGYSGFGSYIKRVVPFLKGTRLQIDSKGRIAMIDESCWSALDPPLAATQYLRFLQRLTLLQHGVNISHLLQSYGFNKHEIDVIYSPFFDSLLTLSSIPQLITCPDLIPLRTHISNKAYLRYRIWQPIHLSFSTKIITYCNHVADQLINMNVHSSRIEIIPCGINISKKRITFPMTRDIIIIARHDNHKNIYSFLKGIAKYQLIQPDWSGYVRIVGKTGRETKKINKALKELPRPKQIKFINSVSQELLTDWIRSSSVLVSSSRDEGFDYPVLEAKAEGLPTLISDIPVHREFHSESSLFFSLDDENSDFCHWLGKLLNDLSLWQDLSKKGYNLAANMSLEKQGKHIQNQMDNLINRQV